MWLLTAAGCVSCTSAAAATISVRAGGDLQQALNTARPGDTIVLEAGSVYRGNFVLPARTDTSADFITIRSSTSDAFLPSANRRIDPSVSERLASLQSPNADPAVRTAPGAHHYRLLFLEVRANRNGEGDIITFGEGTSQQNTVTNIPHDLVIDRCYVHGDPRAGQKRGVALNSGAATVTNSYLSDFKAIGQDSQAAGGWNGPGPFTITNNYLEAAGENVMFGGADPAIRDLVPSDIIIKGNHIVKPVAWRQERWQVKNLFELKNARRVTFSDNLLENNWSAAQFGFAILLTVRNQDGGCPWCIVEEVTLERNRVRHVAAGISILGRDDTPGKPSQQARSIIIRHNLFDDVDTERWGGNGYFLAITGEPRDIVVDHNTIIQPHAYGIVQVDGAPVLEFRFTNNLVRHNDYGFIGTSHGIGLNTIETFFPGSIIEGNVIADANPAVYPGGNRFPTTAELKKQFVAYDNGDYRLTPASNWRRAGTDRLDLGANGLDSSLARGPMQVVPTGP
jgi:hypothetical protein